MPQPPRNHLPQGLRGGVRWGRLHGCAAARAVADTLADRRLPMLLIAPDAATALQFETALRFFLGGDEHIMAFPDQETLPYDRFSPHGDISAARMAALARLPQLESGICIATCAAAMQYLAPASFITAHTIALQRGGRLNIGEFRARLNESGYAAAAQVSRHGEYSVRGGVVDFYPPSCEQPVRIDLFDDEIHSLRRFDPQTQLSAETVAEVMVLPAREFPMDAAAIEHFRRRFRIEFSHAPDECPVYRDISEQVTPGGIECYLPLFFDNLSTLFDYLPPRTLLVLPDPLDDCAREHSDYIAGRYRQLCDDREHPLLEPEKLYLAPSELAEKIGGFRRIEMQTFRHGEQSEEQDEQHDDQRAVATPQPPSGRVAGQPDEPQAETPQDHETAGDGQRARTVDFATRLPPPLAFDLQQKDPAARLREFVAGFDGRVLIAAQSPGYREQLSELLADFGLRAKVVGGWNEFVAGGDSLCLCVGPLHRGSIFEDDRLALITDREVLGQRAATSDRRARRSRDPEALIESLESLEVGCPIVHEEHGIGRFRGLEVLDLAGYPSEFCVLEYAEGHKLYVPVASLHLLSRYIGGDADTAPLHKLGGGQWKKTRRKAAQKARDVAAELLDTQARRDARKGRALELDEADFRAFASAFPYEETPDQSKAIAEIIHDLRSHKPMDRVVCGDVGFGKTEVAMQAAFIAAQNGLQTVVLAPTTLLARQHYETFQDRFSSWPVRIEMLSRFRSRAGMQKSIAAIEDGGADIVIGTHKLLYGEIRFKRLGLIVIDEEHRFGVRDKEKLKALRTRCDVLTLTATPIPRTLSMSLIRLRDLSIIATPPPGRHAVKTFIKQWDDALIREACQRELKRGGQVYFLHNDIRTIEETAERVRELAPQARVAVAHGAMPERALENTMVDFYHRRSNILVCTTIIESGIDIPSANTIIIHRADRLGLAQLHQLRGRVGRSHHAAYAWFLVPPKTQMTGDAMKRLEALESLEELGIGFTLAVHDLEIRGAGELLGEEQSGHIREVGFTMYNKLLKRAVEALRADGEVDMDAPLDTVTDVNLGAPALIPGNYVPDIGLRLVLYRRIAGAAGQDELDALKIEMSDRFGPRPEYTDNLFLGAALRLRCRRLGITRVEAGDDGFRLHFNGEPKFDTGKLLELVREQPSLYRFDGPRKLAVTATAATAAERNRRICGFFDTITAQTDCS